MHTNEAHTLTHTQPQLLLRVLATLQFHQTKWGGCVFPVSTADFQQLHHNSFQSRNVFSHLAAQGPPWFSYSGVP